MMLEYILIFGLIYFSVNRKLTRHYFQMDIFITSTLALLKIFETYFRCRFLSNTLLWPVILKLLL